MYVIIHLFLAIEKVMVNITRLYQFVGPSRESINVAVFAIRHSRQCKKKKKNTLEVITLGKS